MPSLHACLALLPATSVDVAFTATFNARAMQILIHGVLLDTPCCMKNVLISLQRVNGRMGTLFRNLRDHFLQFSLHHVLWGWGREIPFLHILVIRVV
jgi:hypothetical protein